LKRRGEIGRTGLLCLLLYVAVAVSSALVSSASAATTHSFDAGLSLTGGTGVSPEDPIADPGPNHPPRPFVLPCGVAVDSNGYSYVASSSPSGGRIDIFDPDGVFLIEIANADHPCDLAVDALGNLYVVQDRAEAAGVVRYSPDSYPPSSSTDYGSPVPIYSGLVESIAVNRDTGHLYASLFERVIEISNVAEGNTVVRDDIGEGIFYYVKGLAVDASTERLFVGAVCGGCDPLGTHASRIYIFDSSGDLVESILGSDLPGGGFNSPVGNLFPAIDEATGELFVNDTFGSPKRVYRFIPANGSYEYVADPELESHAYADPSVIAVANASSNPLQGAVYVTSSFGSKADPSHHLYVFVPSNIAAPSVGSTTVSAVGRTEAVVGALVNANGAPTTYQVEYVTDQAFDEKGFAEPEVRTGGNLAGNQPQSVSVALTGLTPGTTYHVRISASNACHAGSSEPCSTFGPVPVFATYPIAPLGGPCPNAEFKVGPSADLPDCRAYELVTPSDTNGREPTVALLSGFETELATSDGGRLLFMTLGGALPGLAGNGVSDGYEAIRSSTGWTTMSAAPTGAQSQSPAAGGASPDHSHWFWDTGSENDNGSLVIGDQTTSYVRDQAGDFSLVGVGPAGTDPAADGRWIAPAGAHIIFTSDKPLTSEASPEGVVGLYDRTLDGETRLLSVLPSGQAPKAGSSVIYQGTAASGEAVVFKVTEEGVTTLYEHRARATVPVAEGATTFAGLSEDGSRLTYLKNGNIFSFNAATEISHPVGAGGESVPVNVSADGSHVYFVSHKNLASGAKSGKENFYVWDSSTETISLIGILDPTDVSGVQQTQGTTYGLGQWTEGIGPQQGPLVGPANDPSRTTPAGGTIVFESRANLTGYDSAGAVEVYRYESGGAPSLICLSCSPTRASATSDAHLQVLHASDPLAPTNAETPINNLTDDGSRVFFQTGDALVPADVDGADDVYEWMTAGTGGCGRQQGCVALISAGRSDNPDYLYAATPSGNDVFFSSLDQLLPSDQGGTRSIYDARVNGGFRETAPSACSGESCKVEPIISPAAPPRATQDGSGTTKVKKRCRRGQRKVKRHGKVRCVRKHHRKHHKHAKQGGHR
jgi:hypothetical protein